MSSSVHANNRTKNILILGQSITQGLDNTTLISLDQVNVSATKKRFCLILHYNGTNSYLFVNGIEIIKFKAKHSKIVENPLSSGKISKDFSADNMKKTGLHGAVYDFSINHKVIAVDGILDIHKYLMKKRGI